MSKIYKIQHIPTQKFVRIKLEKTGIEVWKEKNLLKNEAEGKINFSFGKLLHESHKGWKTPPNPSNEDFAEIECKVVVYTVNVTEDKPTS